MLLSADRGVGPWLASFVEALPEGPNVRWQDYVLEVALPEPGSHGMGVSQGVPPFNYDLYLHHSRAAVSLVAAATQRSGKRRPSALLLSCAKQLTAAATLPDEATARTTGLL